VYKAKVTSKGQITLPSEVREALGVQPGERVAFLPTGDGEFRIRRAGSILDLAGCVPYEGPPVTIEEMKRAVGEYVAAQDEATLSPAGRRRVRRMKKRAA
jgi:AbrB family looped-hinge helix DNA binding protein